MNFSSGEFWTMGGRLIDVDGVGPGQFCASSRSKCFNVMTFALLCTVLMSSVLCGLGGCWLGAPSDCSAEIGCLALFGHALRVDLLTLDRENFTLVGRDVQHQPRARSRERIVGGVLGQFTGEMFVGKAGSMSTGAWCMAASVLGGPSLA